MRIDVISSREDLERLRQNWDDLYRADPDAHYFLSWPFISAYCRRFEGSWFVLAARAGTAASPYLALMPLRLRSMMDGKGGYFYNEIHMGGSYVADYTGALCAPERATAAMAAFAKHLKKMHWARLHLTDMRMSAPRQKAFFKHLDDSRLSVREVSRIDKVDNIDNARCPSVDLPDTWDAYLDQKVSANTRQKLRRLLRKLDGSDEYRITLPDAATLERHIDILVDFWRTKWGPRKGNRLAGILRSNRRVFRDSFADGSLFLPVLWRGDRPLGALAIFVEPVKKTYYFYMAGRDEEADDLPPGLVLHAYCIRHAIQNGFRTYDFLRGNEAYKYSFGTTDWINKSRLVRTRSGRNLGDRLDPRSLDAAFRQANRMHKERHLERAENAYRQILDTDSGHAPSLYGLGQLLAGKGDHLEAARTFAALVKSDPKLAKGWARLGDVFQALTHHKEAAAVYRRAVRLDPALSTARFGLAICLAQAGETAQAIAALEIVLRQTQGRSADEPLRVKSTLLLRKLNERAHHRIPGLWSKGTATATAPATNADRTGLGTRLTPLLSGSAAVVIPSSPG